MASSARRIRTIIETIYDRLGAFRGDDGSRRWAFARDVAINLLLGGTIAIALQLAPEWNWLTARRDQAMDWMVQMHSGVSPRGYDAPPFLLLEVGEGAHRSWGEPAQLPRTRLAELIRFAARGDAAVVLVDFDLSRAGEGDEQLSTLLASFDDDRHCRRNTGVIRP